MSALGNRYECFNCEVKFYDLGKREAICPACGSNQADSDESAEEPKTPKKKKAAKKKAKAKPKPEPEPAVGIEDKDDSKDD
jgi:hypothetical protein